MKRQTIPAIDLKSTNARATARKFGGALETCGFAVVRNHGVPVRLLKKAYAVSRRTFALPEDVKRKYEFEGDGRFTGYCSFGKEKAVGAEFGDLKEWWHYRRHVRDDQKRLPAEIADFPAVMDELYGRLDRVGGILLDLVDAHLGQPAGTLAAMAHEGPSLLRLLHYPPIKGQPLAIRAAPHEDINLITLLVSSTAAGLEVLGPDGDWIGVADDPNAIIVNCGDMLQLYTEGRLRSATHRVVNGDGDRARFSIPFFIHARPEVVLDRRTGKTAGECLVERLREIGLMEK